MSLALYAVGVSVSFVSSWIAITIYVSVAIMWIVPDRRIEAILGSRRPAD